MQDNKIPPSLFSACWTLPDRERKSSIWDNISQLELEDEGKGYSEAHAVWQDGTRAFVFEKVSNGKREKIVRMFSGGQTGKFKRPSGIVFELDKNGDPIKETQIYENKKNGGTREIYSLQFEFSTRRPLQALYTNYARTEHQPAMIHAAFPMNRPARVSEYFPDANGTYSTQPLADDDLVRRWAKEKRERGMPFYRHTRARAFADTTKEAMAITGQATMIETFATYKKTERAVDRKVLTQLARKARPVKAAEITSDEASLIEYCLGKADEAAKDTTRRLMLVINSTTWRTPRKQAKKPATTLDLALAPNTALAPPTGTTPTRDWALKGAITKGLVNTPAMVAQSQAEIVPDIPVGVFEGSNQSQEYIASVNAMFRNAKHHTNEKKPVLRNAMGER